jgi:hypothetical protein
MDLLLHPPLLLTTLILVHAIFKPSLPVSHDALEPRSSACPQRRRGKKEEEELRVVSQVYACHMRRIHAYVVPLEELRVVSQV